MKVLAVCLLAVLGCGLAGAKVLTKCSVKTLVQNAMAQLPVKVQQSGLNDPNLVAKIVCYAELVSDFNTSSVTELGHGKGDSHSRGKRSSSHGGGSNSSEVKDNTNDRPRLQDSSEEGDDAWTLYGLFGLSSHLVCNDTITPSPNICNMACDDLINDDESDDVRCVMTLLTNLVENGFAVPHWKDFKRAIRLILQGQCRDLKASRYFSECK